ncbi:uncharacterized protein BCR38DRAFT_413283 [Pseudomassariella vexata]|uniref:Uncharacterized protein n=1 Tax=Pseudomassariella vexata TaxID=1141098 RepID=A0A1Y2DH40_9PEZI|nr:uncharacterized protein BCR38DRAFT_413283 [Pseudomassariella vexata]ORY58414.1 hypothetical protein BCR38DRAFT_413283 [Pseudomassariella vexata]
MATFPKKLGITKIDLPAINPTRDIALYVGIPLAICFLLAMSCMSIVWGRANETERRNPKTFKPLEDNESRSEKQQGYINEVSGEESDETSVYWQEYYKQAPYNSEYIWSGYGNGDPESKHHGIQSHRRSVTKCQKQACVTSKAKLRATCGIDQLSNLITRRGLRQSESGTTARSNGSTNSSADPST